MLIDFSPRAAFAQVGAALLEAAALTLAAGAELCARAARRMGAVR